MQFVQSIKEYFSTYIIQRKLIFFSLLMFAWFILLFSGLTTPKDLSSLNGRQVTEQSFMNGSGEIKLTNQIFSKSNGILLLEFETSDKVNITRKGIDPQKLKWKLYAKDKSLQAVMEVVPIIDSKISVLVKNLPEEFNALAIDIRNTTVNVNQLDLNIQNEKPNEVKRQSEKDEDTIQFIVSDQSKNLKFKSVKNLSQQDFAIQELANEKKFQFLQKKKLEKAIQDLRQSIKDDESNKEALIVERQYLTTEEKVSNRNDIEHLESNIQSKENQIQIAKENIEKVEEKIVALKEKEEAIQNGLFEFSPPIEIEINR